MDGWLKHGLAAFPRALARPVSMLDAVARFVLLCLDPKYADATRNELDDKMFSNMWKDKCVRKRMCSVHRSTPCQRVFWVPRPF